MRSNSLKHNNLMLRSERRERLEAWAASDSQIQHSQYSCRRTSNRNGIRIMDFASALLPSKFVSEAAAMYNELRKAGHQAGSGNRCPGLWHRRAALRFPR